MTGGCPWTRRCWRWRTAALPPRRRSSARSWANRGSTSRRVCCSTTRAHSTRPPRACSAGTLEKPGIPGDRVPAGGHRGRRGERSPGQTPGCCGPSRWPRPCPGLPMRTSRCPALARGDTAGALRRLDDGLAFFPRSRELRVMKARVLIRAGDSAGASGVLGELVAERPSDVESALLLLSVQGPGLSPEASARRLWKLFDLRARGPAGIRLAVRRSRRRPGLGRDEDRRHAARGRRRADRRAARSCSRALRRR